MSKINKHKKNFQFQETLETHTHNPNNIVKIRELLKRAIEKLILLKKIKQWIYFNHTHTHWDSKKNSNFITILLFNLKTRSSIPEHMTYLKKLITLKIDRLT